MTLFNDPLASIDNGPCSSYAPDTLAPDPEDRGVCTSCYYRGEQHNMEIWILAITHEYGVNLSAYSTKEDAEYDLAQWCRLEWQDKFRYERPIPEEQSEVIEMYFHAIPDSEYYDLDNVTLDERCYK